MLQINQSVFLIHSIFLVHSTSALLMTGVMLVIHFLHYPSFEYISLNKSTSFHEFHSKRITFIVFPLMFTELLSSIILAYINLDITNIIILSLTFLTWFITLNFCVKDHKNLRISFSIDNQKRLLRSDLFRTIVWTLKSILIIILLFKL